MKKSRAKKRKAAVSRNLLTKCFAVAGLILQEAEVADEGDDGGNEENYDEDGAVLTSERLTTTIYTLATLSKLGKAEQN